MAPADHEVPADWLLEGPIIPRMGGIGRLSGALPPAPLGLSTEKILMRRSGLAEWCYM
jgi:hypothetical protein